MPNKERHRYGEITSHITIEEARERGLWRIVKQLELDKKVIQSLGMKPLNLAIQKPRKDSELSKLS